MSCTVINMVIGMLLTTDTPLTLSIEDCNGTQVVNIVESNTPVTIISQQDGIYYVKPKNKEQ